MPVVECQCGSRFNAAEHLVGKRVPCPNCNRPLQVALRPAAGTVVICQCGGQFLAEPSLAGKQVACPTCHRPLAIPARATATKPSAAVRVQAAPNPFPQPSNTRDDPFAAAASWPVASHPIPQTLAPRRTASKPFPTRKVVIAGVIALAIVSITVTSIFAWRAISTALAGGSEFVNIPSSQQLIQEAESNGEPMTPAALEAYYRLPAGARDATNLWVTAGQSLAGDEFQSEIARFPLNKELPLPGQSWAELSAARLLVEKYRNTLQQAYAAADMGGAARYPTKFAEGIAMLLPEVQNCRYLFRLLHLEAYVRAHEGDPAGCARSLRTILSLAHSLDDFPILVPSLVRNSIAAGGEKLLVRLVPYCDFSDADLDALRLEIERLQSVNSFHKALLGERVVTFTGFTNPEQSARMSVEYMFGDDPDHAEKQKAAEIAAKLSGELDKAHFLHIMKGYIAASKERFPASLDSFETAHAELEKLMRASKLAKARRPLTLLLLPATKTASEVNTRTETNLRLGLTTIALARYQRETGRLPETLQPLVPKFLKEIPADPFDGKPLRLRYEGNHAIVYSVGPDRRDDRGATDDRQQPDIAVVLPSPFPAVRSASANSPSRLQGRLNPQVKTGTPNNLLNTLAGRWDLATVQGNWVFQNGVLVSSAVDQASWKKFSSNLPQSYQLTADVEILSGEGSFNLAFGVDGHPVMLVLDGWDGEHSGLNLVNGQTATNNETTHTGRLLVKKGPNQIRIAVQAGFVTVHVNGEPIVLWSGDPKELSLDGRFWPAWDGNIYVGSWHTSFRLSRLELAPLQD